MVDIDSIDNMGRHPTGRVPIQPLRIIGERHKEIMRRLIVGETQHRIAKDLGMSESRLSIICNSPLFKRELSKLESEVKVKFVDHTANVAARLDELQPEAIKVLELIVTKNKDENNFPIPLRLKKDTALDILELAGSGKKKTKDDDIGDLTKLITEGFKLATAMKQLNAGDNSTGGNGGGNGDSGGNGNSGHTEKNITPQPQIANTAAVIEDIEYNISELPDDIAING